METPEAQLEFENARPMHELEVVLGDAGRQTFAVADLMWAQISGASSRRFGAPSFSTRRQEWLFVLAEALVFDHMWSPQNVRSNTYSHDSAWYSGWEDERGGRVPSHGQPIDRAWDLAKTAMRNDVVSGLRAVELEPLVEFLYHRDMSGALDHCHSFFNKIWETKGNVLNYFDGELKFE